jgi:hypothetical protein
MKPRASILRIRPGKYEIVERELDDPQTTEVPAKTVATDLCPPMIMSLPATSQFQCLRSAEDARGRGSSPIDRYRDPGVRLRNEELCL